MQVHIFTNEGLYSNSLIKLLEKQLDLEEHLFIFRKQKSTGQDYSEKLSKRIIYSSNFRSLLCEVLPILRKAKWIYFHYLPYGPSLLLWAVSPDLLRKSTWIIWGGDVFIYKEKNRNAKTRLYELLRHISIPNFPEMASFIEEDAREAMSIYRSKAQYIPILYPIPLSINQLKDLPKKTENRTLSILLGNSADPSNFHIETIEFLARFKNQSIKVYCPLSYYTDSTYVDKVIQLGKDYFKDNFIPIKNMMTPTEYAGFLAGMDVGIMNHRRQQALGNVLPLLFLGKKVFLRSDISTYRFLDRAGCIIFDIKSIADCSFKCFSEMANSAKQINKRSVEKITSDEYCTSLWLNLLNKHQQ